MSRNEPPVGRPSNNEAEFRIALSRDGARGFRPRFVLFDGRYIGLDNLKLVRSPGWNFLGRLKSNRPVRLDREPPTRLDALPVAESGMVVWRPGYGLLKVFRSVAPNGGAEHRVTNEPDLDEAGRVGRERQAWAVDTYHRGLKQHTGVERCQLRAARAQCDHIGLALRAFVRREYHRVASGVTWFEAEWAVIREAVRAYLAAPRYRLPEAATA